MGQRLAGSGVAETRRAGREGVLSKAPAWSSPGGRELLRPPAWGWMGCASGSPHHCMLWAQEQLWSLPSTVKWAACVCDLLQGPICPQSLTCGGEVGSGHQALCYTYFPTGFHLSLTLPCNYRKGDRHFFLMGKLNPGKSNPVILPRSDVSC